MGRKPGERKRAEISLPGSVAPVSIDRGFLGDIRSLIESARGQVAQFVNSAMVVTY